MAFTQDFRTQRRNYNDGETRIGEKDRLWYDSGTNSIRIGDGETPGGIVVGGSGGGSDYTLPTASALVKGGVKIGSNISITDGVISVAAPFSGSYNDLTNKPTIPSLTGYATETFVTTRGYLTSVGTISYNDLSNKPTLFDGAYASLSGKPTLFSGSYTDLTNKPSLFSGSYTDLTNKPTIPSLSGYATESYVTSRGYLTSTSTLVNGTYTVSLASTGQLNLPGAANTESNNARIQSASSIDILSNLSIWTFSNTGTLTFPNSTVQSTAWTGSVAYANVTGTPTLATVATSGSYSDLSNKPTLFDGAYASLSGKPTLFSGSYTDLTSKPTIYSSAYIGTTSLDFTRSSASQTLNGVSIDGSVTWTNPSPAPGDPFRTAISANSGNASISLSTGLPNLGSTVSWTFDTTKITFPDTTTQTTAYTATAAKGLFSVTTNSASGNGSLSYSNGVFTFTPASVPTTVTINGTAVTLGSSGTVTAAAGTLTGNTLASGVTASSLTSVGTLTSLTSSGLVRFNSAGVGGSYNAAGNSVNIGGVLGVASNIYANGNIDIVAGSAYYIGGTAVLNGTTLGSNIVNSSLTSVGTLTSLTSTGSVTANHTTAFIAGDNAISGVALQMPREGALRNTHNGANNNMYFDVSTGGTSHGQFQFRSSSAFTNVLTMSPTAFNVSTDAVVTARTPSFGRLPFNSAIDTELTIDDMRFRISNQGGIFPQVIGNGSSRNLAWTVVAARSGSAVTQTGSTGTIVASNAWTSLYTSGGMDSAGDTYVATIQDKGASRIYRVTFMRSDNGSTTGYNIIAERLL